MLVMAQRWAMIERTLQAHIDALVQELGSIEALAGMTPEQLYRMDRYQALVMQVREQLRLYEHWAEGQITASQRQAIEMGRETVTESLSASGLGISWNRLPVVQ